MNCQQFDCNTKENFVDIPVRLLIFLIKKLDLFTLFQTYVKDGREKKGIYSIASLLMVALQMPIFRCPSKNDFYQNRKLGRGCCYKNLGALAQIKCQQFPHCKTIDDAFFIFKSSRFRKGLVCYF